MTSFALIPLLAAPRSNFTSVILVALVMLGGPILKKITDAREQAERAKSGKPPARDRRRFLRVVKTSFATPMPLGMRLPPSRRRLPAARIRSATKSSSFWKRWAAAVLPPTRPQRGEQ